MIKEEGVSREDLLHISDLISEDYGLFFVPTFVELGGLHRLIEIAEVRTDILLDRVDTCIIGRGYPCG